MAHANGILIIDKPAGWTSHDVVAKLRRALSERRIGHAGTLDPMATGVLPVFVGRATRAVEFAAEGGKTYRTTLRLGLTTTTQDTTGETVSTAPVALTSAQLEGVLNSFRGEILQIPPMYSAIKQDGKRLYELARKGMEVARAPRAVTIHSLTLVEQVSETDFILEITCSKGTYIRTLCHDIGAAIGCGGCMAQLRRTAAAGYTLAQARTMDEVLSHPEPAGLLLPLDTQFASHPPLAVDARGEGRIRNGQSLSGVNSGAGTYRVYGPSGVFLALGEVKNGVLTVIKSFFEP